MITLHSTSTAFDSILVAFDSERAALNFVEKTFDKKSKWKAGHRPKVCLRLVLTTEGGAIVCR